MTIRTQEPVDEFAELLGRAPAAMERILRRIAAAELRDRTGRAAVHEEELADLIGETMILADLLGRRRALLEVAAAGIEAQPARFMDEGFLIFANPPPPARGRALFGIPFIRAVRDLVTRSIELVDQNLRPRWREVARLYRTRHAFALARSASRIITQRVRRKVARLMREGVTLRDAERQVVAEIPGEARWYGAVVYRTNLATAYTAGQQRETVENPIIRATFPAWEVQGIADASERSNHAVLRGLIAGVTSNLWLFYSPPYGYNCRHVLSRRPITELDRMGLLARNGEVVPFLPPNIRGEGAVLRAIAERRGGPDPGFGTRADQRLYGGR